MKNTTKEIIAVIGPRGIPADFPGTSGLEMYVANQLPPLMRRGNIVRCYTRRWSSQGHIPSHKGATIIPLPTINTTFLDTLVYSLLATLHASVSDATIIWYHGIGSVFFSFMPKLVHKRIHITIHSLEWHRKKWGFFARLFLRLCEQMAVACSDEIFVVSTQLQGYFRDAHHKDAVLQKYPFMRRRCITPSVIRRKYHLTKNSYVLFLGRFVPEKRIEWLIRAGTDNPDVTIVLAGGSSHTDRYEGMLRSMAKKQRVIFTGYVFGKEKAELLSNCAFFVLPSQLEGFPVSVSEALGYRKRCLVGDFLKPEFSPDHKLLTYFSHNDYHDFLNKFRRLVNDSHLP